MKEPKNLSEYYESYYSKIWTLCIIFIIFLLIVGFTMDDNGIWIIRMIPIGFALFICLCVCISIPYNMKKIRILKEQEKKNEE